jgi:hypothetical protein
VAVSQEAIIERFLLAQNRLVLQASDLSLDTLANMVKKGAIDLSPQYQRRERWSHDKQSLLIESFILNIPVPPIYLSEDAYGRYSVIDGKQRLSAICAFMSNVLTLNATKTFHELTGHTYDTLPQDIQYSLSVRPYLRVVSILKQSDPGLKYEVFTRLNVGGERLNPQEIRNVAFRGPLNDLIVSLSGNSFLRKQLKITSEKSPAYRKMDDVEYVLRFLTLEENWKDFSGSLAQSMDTFMARHRNISGAKALALQTKFERSIGACKKIWGSKAFKRPDAETWREQFIAGMFDAEMIAVSAFSDAQILKLVEHSPQILNLTVELFRTDSRFDEAVRLGTNTPSRIKYRVEQMRSRLKSVL